MYIFRAMSILEPKHLFIEQNLKLGTNRRQAIIWTNDEPLQERSYVPSGHKLIFVTDCYNVTIKYCYNNIFFSTHPSKHDTRASHNDMEDMYLGGQF